jgi:hypothetical protein
MLQYTNPDTQLDLFKNIKFYMLNNIPGVEHKDIRTCTLYAGMDGPPHYHLFTTLYKSSERVDDISQAKIFFVPFHHIFHGSRFCDLRWTNMQHSDKPLEDRLIELAVDFFHDLKHNGTIASDARLFLVSYLAYWTKIIDYNSERYSDISFINTDALQGGVHPGKRGRNDITIDTSLVPHCGDRPQPTQNLPAAENYDNYALFKGRFTHRHAYKSTRDAFWEFPKDEHPLNYRVPGLRRKFVTALNTDEARAMKVVVEGPVPQLEKKQYLHLISTTHYCFHLPGESSYSCRFYSSLRFGCIPVIINGGWNLPYTPLINWDKLAIRIDERFNFSDVTALIELIDYKSKALAQKHYEGDLHNWHRAIWHLGHSAFGGLNNSTQFTKVIDAAKLMWMREKNPRLY